MTATVTSRIWRCASASRPGLSSAMLRSTPSRRRSARAASRRSSRRGSRRSCGRSANDPDRPPARGQAGAHAGGGGPQATPTADGLMLDWLPDVSVPRGPGVPLLAPGVGRKTAACVLLFSFGMRDVPVDTHVSRVGTRLSRFRRAGPVRGAPRPDARADPAGSGAGAPPEPAAARAPDLPRPRAGLRGLRPAPDVPEGRRRGCLREHTRGQSDRGR